ncbi:glycosyltransferase [Leifsonia sp. AG29]|uniref:glycosyltransferase n=1 Tax=Leifsonia sp. AG29 TaxID=2598860 RepID=UPI00131E151D|nr:glycosyltransferase family 2 protein [Leifsonia sp. AG29]
MTNPRPGSTPTVSVVIPCWNDGAMLGQCLEALAAQTVQPFEVIVVDGDSSDDSHRVATEAGARVITATGGIPDATAAGLDAARGDILARIDADSRPSPDWLQRIRDDFDRPGTWSAVTGTGTFYGTNPLLAWAGRALYLGGYFHAVGPMLGHPPLFGSNFAIRRETWSRMSPLVHRDRRRIHDDLDLSIQLEPDMTVLYDPSLRMSVSGRQLASWSSFRRHISWSVNTFALNHRRMSLRARRRQRRDWRGVTKASVPPRAHR